MRDKRTPTDVCGEANSHTVVLETLIDNVKLKFFYLSVLWNYYAYTYTAFSIIFSHSL